MTVAVVVPCFQEADRFDRAAFERLSRHVDRLVFVDDGSTDGTREVLEQLAAAAPARIEVVALARNSGKGEAVRAGMQAAATTADIIGYYDADLATPPAELLRLIEKLQCDESLQVVLGSRVALLGHSIERHAARHYLGRLYATAASLVLGVGVYDTQCGAKLFRRSPTLEAAIATPFPDRWSFDVELLARLLNPSDGLAAVNAGQIVEVPLGTWRDVGGSKLRPTAAVRSMLALAGVRRRIARRRR